MIYGEPLSSETQLASNRSEFTAQEPVPGSHIQLVISKLNSLRFRRLDEIEPVKMSTTAAQQLTRKERSALAEQRMLDAAIHLIAEHGYENTTLAAIGELAGYSRGLATHHFGSKAELFSALIRQRAMRFDKELDAGRETGDALQALLQMTDKHREAAKNDPASSQGMLVLWLQSMIGDSPMRQPATQNLLQTRDRVQRVIERGVINGTIRAGINPHEEAIQICGSWFGLLLQWLIDPVQSDLDETHECLKASLLERLAP